MMHWGLLWYDPRPVEIALPAAAARYVARWGQTPNVCYVHPAMTPEGKPESVNQVRVKTSSLILKFHFWIGVEAVA